MRQFNLEYQTVEEFKNGRKEDETKFPIFCKLMESLRKFEGKEVSKRIETHLAKEFPEYRFFYFSEYGRMRLNVYERNRTEHGYIFNEIVLGDSVSSIFSFDRVFNELNPYYGIAAKNRIEFWTTEKKEEYIKMLENYYAKIEEMKMLRNDLYNFRGLN